MGTNIHYFRTHLRRTIRCSIASRCPSIDEAISALTVAQRDLRAWHDFCGHRQTASEATDCAVSELRSAETCVKCN